MDVHAISAMRCDERDAKSFVFGLTLDTLLHHHGNVVCRLLGSVRSTVQDSVKENYVEIHFSTKDCVLKIYVSFGLGFIVFFFFLFSIAISFNRANRGITYN